MHRSIRSFNNPLSRTTHGHLTDVRAREGGELDQKGLFVGGNFNLASGGVGHLNRKYEFESEVSSSFSAIHELFFEMEEFKNGEKKRSSNAVQICVRLSSVIFRFYSLNSQFSKSQR